MLIWNTLFPTIQGLYLCVELRYSLGASQSTQKLFPLTFRMDWMAIASLWLPNRDCKKTRERTSQQELIIARVREGKQLQPDSNHRQPGMEMEGRVFFFKVLGKEWGRENMNMKMRPCLPSMLTQAVFYLWCLSVLIRDPPLCGAPVWQPPTCDSLKWVRRGDGGGSAQYRLERREKGRMLMKQQNCRTITMLWLDSNRQSWRDIAHLPWPTVPCSLCSHKTAGWQRSGSQSLGPTVPSPRM